MSDDITTPRQLALKLLGIEPAPAAPAPKPDEAPAPVRSVPDEGLQRAIDEGVRRSLAALGIEPKAKE